MGALIGLTTMVVSTAEGIVVSEVALSPVNFLLQAQVTAIPGGFVTGWATRFIPDDRKGRSG